MMARKAGGAPRGIGRRLLLGAVLLGVVWFAVQGGEYGTFDLVSQRSHKRALEAEVAEAQRVVDSLVKWKKAIETDPAVQERIAREEFGMVRGNREFLYRFVGTDTTRR
jgi:cell division protein FtsB